MKEKKNNNKNRRKTNIFIVFLICSALIWLISKLSETYTQRTSFDLSFVNAPDSLLITGTSKQAIDVRLRASGFKFLSFKFGRRDLKIDLSQIKNDRNSFFVHLEEYQRQIENQLPGSMSLIEIDRDTLFVYFEQLFSKQVKIIPDLTINLAQNHLLEGPLVVDPPFVTIKGPKSEIQNIEEVHTAGRTISDISENFTSSLALLPTEEYDNITYSSNTVEVSGKVFRFSEQLIDIPVKVINLPEGVEIKTFPNEVSVLCKAKIDRLKNIRPGEFELIADFNSARPDVKILEVQLVTKPQDVYDAQVMDNELEFILIRR